MTSHIRRAGSTPISPDIEVISPLSLSPPAHSMAQLNKPGKRERDNPSSSYGAMQYFRQAQTDFKPPLISGDNAFLGDIASSEDKDDFSPMTCGFYRQEKGTSPSQLAWQGRWFVCKLIMREAYRSSTTTPTTR